MIIVRIPLELNKEEYKLNLTYNTYEKIAFDQYLCSLISKYEKNKKNQYKYIDDITGNGSLNHHFKSLLSEIKHLSSDDVEKAIKNNLYPIKKVENYNVFKYFPTLNISLYENHLLKKNPKQIKVEEIKQMLTINGDIVEMKFLEKEATNDVDNYDVRFNSNGNIEVKINNGWFTISERDFIAAKKTENIKFDNEIKIQKMVTDDNKLFLLTNEYLKELSNNPNSFISSEKKNIQFNSERIIVTNVYDIHNTYFYNEELYEYSNKNKKIILEILNHILDNNNLNATKDILLHKLILSIDVANAIKFIDSILIKKESKLIAEDAINIIAENFDLVKKLNCLSDSSLITIKKFANINNLNEIYKLNPNIKYLDDELCKIDTDLLSKEHKVIKEEYLANRNKIIKEINEKMGEITNSGIRERVKKYNFKQPFVKELGKKINDMQAHKKDDIKNYSDEKLKNYLNKVNDIYNLYKKTSKLIDDEEEKKKDTNN